MLPVIDPEGTATGRQIVVYALALLPVSLAPTLLGLAGPIYFAGALVLGLVFLSMGVWTALARSGAAARRLFVTSLAYLPCLLLLMTSNVTALSDAPGTPRCCPPPTSQS
jgi:protoheme IX farnesyltransferase